MASKIIPLTLALLFMGCAGDEGAKKWAQEESKKQARKQRLAKLASVPIEVKVESKPIATKSEEFKDSDESVDSESQNEDISDDKLAQDYGNELTEDDKKEIKQSSHKNLWGKLQECRDEVKSRERWGQYSSDQQERIWNEYLKTAQRNEQLERQVQDLMVKLNTQNPR